MNIKELRELPATWKWRIYKAGLTQREFCHQFELTQSQLSDWISGRKPPRYESIERIEGYLSELGV